MEPQARSWANGALRLTGQRFLGPTTEPHGQRHVHGAAIDRPQIATRLHGSICSMLSPWHHSDWGCSLLGGEGHWASPCHRRQEEIA
jgi:hypothetical protein